MNRRSTTSFYVWLLAAMGLVPAVGRAQVCSGDADCGIGFACEPYPEEPACGGAQPEQFKACFERRCGADADCPAAMKCWQRTTSICREPNCCANDDACRARGTSCADQTDSTCAPLFIPPCEQASDCGEGFDCVEDSEFVCHHCEAGEQAGIAGGGAGAAGQSDSGSSPVCCDHVLRLTCRLRRQECTDAAGCPRPLGCDDNPAHQQCMGGAGASGGQETCTTVPGEPAKLCGLNGYGGFAIPIAPPPAMADASTTQYVVHSAAAGSGSAGKGVAGATMRGTGGSGSEGAANPNSEAGCSLASPGSARHAHSGWMLAGALFSAAIARRRRLSISDRSR